MTVLKTTIAFTFALIGLGCSGSASSNTVSDKSTPAPTVASTATPTDELAAGRKLYSQNCAACHREDGTGGEITIEGKSIDPDDLTSEKIKKFDDNKIICYVTKGIEDEGMPSFKDKLSETQIREVVNYVRTGIQKTPSSKNNQPAR